MPGVSQSPQITRGGARVPKPENNRAADRDGTTEHKRAAEQPQNRLFPIEIEIDLQMSRDNQLIHIKTPSSHDHDAANQNISYTCNIRANSEYFVLWNSLPFLGTVFSQRTRNAQTPLALEGL